MIYGFYALDINFFLFQITIMYEEINNFILRNSNKFARITSNLSTMSNHGNSLVKKYYENSNNKFISLSSMMICIITCRRIIKQI